MATSPVITGAQTRAPSNVTRLPTATARKVRQPTPRRCRLAVDAGSAVPIPIDWRSPWDQEREAQNKLLARVERTPEMLLTLAILKALAVEQARIVITQVSAVAAVDSCDAVRTAKLIALTMLPREAR